MDKNRPIGVFDSGVGGLSVVKEIFKQLPKEEIIYFGDTAHVPYGPRCKEELLFFADQISDFLIEMGVKIIVVACNTSSSVSLDKLKVNHAIPFLGVIEPGVNAALKATRKNKIGVIATEATIKSNAHRQMLLEKCSDIQVYTQSCPKFVPLVEQGITEGGRLRKAAQEYLTPLKAAGIDTLLLGCTHYPFLIDVLQDIMGQDVQIIDPAAETVGQLKTILVARSALHEIDGGADQYFVSGNPQSFQAVASNFIDKKLPIVQGITLATGNKGS